MMTRRAMLTILTAVLAVGCGPDQTGSGTGTDNNWKITENNTATNNSSPNNTVSPNNTATNNVSPNNIAPNNTSPNNVAPNNVSPNNVAPNNTVPNNVSPNNTTTCADGEVYLSADLYEGDRLLATAGCYPSCDGADCAPGTYCAMSDVGGICIASSPEDCGNGQIDDGETCDGDCPSGPNQCPPPPPEACIETVYDGSPDRCDAICDFRQIEACRDGDGCCPDACDANTDNDCSVMGPVCGDGVVEGNETCEGDCPQSLSDCPAPPPMACVRATFMGDPDMCTSACGAEMIVACQNDDGCCAAGCDHTSDNDCTPPAPMCGNGIVESPEVCDGDCPSTVADCDDQNACTIDGLMGSNCSSQCTHQQTTSCAQDGCCNATCAADPDCSETDLCGQPIVANNNGPASVISAMAIESQSCCFDYTGNNQPDNALGQLLDLAGARSDTNMGLQQAIDSGQQALVLEHEGLSGITATPSYTINMLQGSPQCFQAPAMQGGNVYHIDAASYDAAGNPLATLPMSALTSADAIVSGVGTLSFVLDFVGASLVLPLRHARLTADIARTRSGLPDIGIGLDNGRLGGVLKITELFDSINTFAATSCSCYSNPNNLPLINYTSASNASCEASISANQCGNSGVDGACKNLRGAFCDQIQFISFFADVDSNAPGTSCGNNCDAMSVGISFTAHGARIQ